MFPPSGLGERAGPAEVERGCPEPALAVSRPGPLAAPVVESGRRDGTKPEPAQIRGALGRAGSAGTVLARGKFRAGLQSAGSTRVRRRGGKVSSMPCRRRMNLRSPLEVRSSFFTAHPSSRLKYFEWKRGVCFYALSGKVFMSLNSSVVLLYKTFHNL